MITSIMKFKSKLHNNNNTGNFLCVQCKDEDTKKKKKKKKNQDKVCRQTVQDR